MLDFYNMRFKNQKIILNLIFKPDLAKYIGKGLLTVEGGKKQRKLNQLFTRPT
jgi:hypothetical protein